MRVTREYQQQLFDAYRLPRTWGEIPDTDVCDPSHELAGIVEGYLEAPNGEHRAELLHRGIQVITRLGLQEMTNIDTVSAAALYGDRQGVKEASDLLIEASLQIKRGYHAKDNEQARLMNAACRLLRAQPEITTVHSYAAMHGAIAQVDAERNPDTYNPKDYLHAALFTPVTGPTSFGHTAHRGLIKSLYEQLITELPLKGETPLSGLPDAEVIVNAVLAAAQNGRQLPLNDLFGETPREPQLTF